MSGVDELLSVLLRCIGVFYLVAALFGLRAIAMDAFLSQALDSLAPEEPRARAADRLRSRYLVLSTFSMGLGAIALVGMLALAFWLFALTSALHLLFLGIVAPRAVDTVEPAEPGSRRRSWTAAAVYAAATVFLGAAAWTGLLRPISAEPSVSALVGFGALAFAGYALWTLKPWSRLPRLRPVPDSPASPAVHWEDEAEDIRLPDLDAVSIVLAPSWGEGAVIDAATGRALNYDVMEALLTGEERDLIQDWLCLFRDVGDPADPRRCRIRDGDGLAKLEALGRPIYEKLSARLGSDRVSFEPAPRPRGPDETFAAITVMADYGSHPLWHRSDAIFGCIPSEDAGISWGLARHLDEWAMAIDESIDPDDPGGPSKWTPAQVQAHDQEGLDLARRLRGEFDATGREHVEVYYRPALGEEVRVERP